MVEFKKVSFEQFLKDCNGLQAASAMWFASEDEIRQYYDAIPLPRRATSGSAGYDFYMPFPASFITLSPVMIPTGIRVILEPGQFLMCVPRSGLGFKYSMGLVNTLGIIDSDYAFSENEGHIMAKIDTGVPFKLNTGDRFMQGIILNYSVADHDRPIKKSRNGGFGSTGGAGQLEGQICIDDILSEGGQTI